jgi:adenosylcobinamide-GDP ribazoletransferase
MKILKAMVIAFSIYSKIPVPQFEWKEEDMEYMMCFFPWIGGVIGLAFFGWAVLCEKFAVGTLCYALIAAAIPLIISGGFHVDGYMDTMDALHSYQSREKKLEILKDSHIGAFAAIMLVLYYLIDIAAISEIHTRKAVFAVAAVFFLARCLSGIAVVTLQPAKKEGLLYTFASGAQKEKVKRGLYLQLILCMALMIIISKQYGVAAIIASLLSFLYFKKKSYKEFGGITGDTAGFFVTVCEAAAAVAVAIAGA